MLLDFDFLHLKLILLCKIFIAFLALLIGVWNLCLHQKACVLCKKGLMTKQKSVFTN